MIVQSMIIIGIAYFKSMIGHFIYLSLNDICTHSEPALKAKQIDLIWERIFPSIEVLSEMEGGDKKKKDMALMIHTASRANFWRL